MHPFLMSEIIYLQLKLMFLCSNSRNERIHYPTHLLAISSINYHTSAGILIKCRYLDKHCCKFEGACSAWVTATIKESFRLIA